MKRTLLSRTVFNTGFLVVITVLLTLPSFAQSVSIVPAGTPIRPNLIPIDHAVGFSINPMGFGNCMSNLAYEWVVQNANNEIVFQGTLSNPKYSFSAEGTYTVGVTLTTLPGGYCAANLTKTASSTH